MGFSFPPPPPRPRSYSGYRYIEEGVINNEPIAATRENNEATIAIEELIKDLGPIFTLIDILDNL